MALEAYYKMNTGWPDASGNDRDGSPSGAVINNVDQKIGSGCGEFLANDEVTFSSYYDPSGTTEFSLMGWLKSDNGALNKGIYGSQSGANSIWVQSHNSGGDGLYFAIGSTAGKVLLDTKSAYIHFAFVFDGAGVTDADRMKIYVDSVQQSLAFNIAVPSIIPTIILPPVLGRINGISRFWDGLLDNIELNSNAVTQPEINESYNGGLGREIIIAALGGREETLMSMKRKYGVAGVISGIPLYKAGSANYISNPTLAVGDVKISKDDAAFVNLATLPTVTPSGDISVKITLSASELTCQRAVIRFVDQSATKEWEPRTVIIEIYGAASAQHAFDLDTAIQDVNLIQISGDSNAANNLESQYDETGLSGDTFPSTQSQLSGLANVGSAINRPAVSYNLTTGTQSANTYTATEALDGTNHEHTDDASALDLYYEFNIGAGFASSVQVTGYIQGVNDDIDVYGYDWVAAAWVQIGNLQGSALANNQVNSYDMFVDMVGSGANQGVVRVRFYKASGLTNATLAVDQIFVAFNQTAEGYQNAAIWFDSNASNTKTVKGIDGTATNPVSTMAAVNTLLASTGLSRVEILPHSTVIFTTSQNDRVFSGEHWTLDLNGQDIEGLTVIGAHTSGAVSGIGNHQEFVRCYMGATSHLKETHFTECGFIGKQTVIEAGDFFFDRCRSHVAATGSFEFDFGDAIGNTNLNWRNGSGGIQLESMGDTGTDKASIEGRGQIIEGTCTGGIVAVRGAFTTSGITNLTLSDDARYDINQILDEPSAGLAIILDAIKTRLASTIFATEHPPATVSVPLGTILEGDITSIQTLDQNYLKIQETEKYEIETTYTNIDEVHGRVYLTYRYFGTGSSNHKVELEIWNYVTSQYDDVVATEQDLPATNVDSSLIFDIPGTLSDYYTGSLPNLSAKLRIRHVSNNTTDHQFWLDTIGFGELEAIYEAPDNASIEIIREFAETFIPVNLIAPGGGYVKNIYWFDGGTLTIKESEDIDIPFAFEGNPSGYELWFVVTADLKDGPIEVSKQLIEGTDWNVVDVDGTDTVQGSIPFIYADTNTLHGDYESAVIVKTSATASYSAWEATLKVTRPVAKVGQLV